MGRISRTDQQRVRHRLLETAANRFARDGYDAANIDQIALAAGVAKGTVYNYFPSKERLFGAVLAEAARRAVDRYTANPPFPDTRGALRALARADLAVLRAGEAFMKVLVGEAMNPRRENYPVLLEHLAPFLGAVSEILDRGVRDGQVRDDRPVPQLALTFVGILTLFYIQHWKSGGRWPEWEEVPDLAVGTFLDGAAGPAASPPARARGRPP